MAPPDESVDRTTRATLRKRRALLRRTGRAVGLRRVPLGAMGLAFSGGGIRSATVSLGVAQALERSGQLRDFDYCSTVSGGGYFGSFLTSLYLPEWARGPGARTRPDDDLSGNKLRALQRRANMATRALTAKVDAEDLPKPAGRRLTDAGRMRNPVWWLREHGRYLAPNGTADYLNAAVYMMRNWLAVMFLITLPVAAMAFGAILFDRVMAGTTLPGTLLPAMLRTGALWLPVAGGVILTLAVLLSYWFTNVMTNRADRGPSGTPAIPFLLVTAAPLAAVAIAGIAYLCTGGAFGADLPALAARLGWLAPFLGGAAGLVLLAATVAFGIGIWTWRQSFSGDAYIAEVRRLMTRWSGNLVAITIILFAIALVDLAAIRLYHWLAVDKPKFGELVPATTILLPVIAWLIYRLGGVASDRGQRTWRLLRRAMPMIALIASVVLLAILAIAVHVALQGLLFGGLGWDAATNVAADVTMRACLLAALLALLLFGAGASSGLVNLSSLHNIYASRLTRAYLGASNVERLKSASSGTVRRNSIMDSHPGDQIPVDIYQQTSHLGPLHLINVTLNETRSAKGAQLIDRDRKGVPLVFAPEGIFVNAGRRTDANDHIGWSALEENRVERFSVGQLCAISGAAASTGMGPRTTLGTSFAFTLANVRLGYWWKVKNSLCADPGAPIGVGRRVVRFLKAHVAGTFHYLGKEMLGRYSRNDRRVYLSDGGHFDNSGVYELLRRKEVKLIVASDNGADPEFRFADLENLIRKARLDLGLSVNLASPEQIARLFPKAARPLFLNGDGWRQRAGATRGQPERVAADDRACCLLLEVYDNPDPATGPAKRILWLKPRLFAGLTQDINGYAAGHPDFPHETTGDQFFGEAQWESYRAIGYCMMASVLATLGGKLSTLIPK